MVIKKIFGTIVILLLSFEFTSNMAEVADMPTYDELNYMWSGAQFPHELKADWGPLYSLQYYALSFFAEDKVSLYYLNQKLVLTLMPIGFFLLLSAKVRHRYALTVSIPLIYMSSNVMVFTHIDTISTFLLLIGGWLVFSKRLSLLSKITSLSFILLLAAYVRPEFYLLFLFTYLLIALPYTFFKLATHWQPRTLIFPAIICAIWMLKLLYIGSPIGGERSVFAFQQMYAQNYLEWQGIYDVLPDYQSISNTVFGHINSIGDSIESNPEEVWRHFNYNFGKTMEYGVWKMVDQTMPRRFIDHEPYYNYDYFIECVGIIASMTILLLLLLKRRETQLPRIGWLWILLSAAIIAQGVAKCTFIYPYVRYLTAPSLFLYATIIMFLCSRLQFRYRLLSIITPIVLLATILSFRPKIQYYFHGEQINKKVFLAYEQLDFVYGDTVLVSDVFLGLSYPPAVISSLNQNALNEKLNSGNIKAILTTQQQMQSLSPITPKYHTIAINDTLNLYYTGTLGPSKLSN